VSIVNQKGGVGKTTTTVNVSAALAALGKSVLIIDLDPQGNSSTGLGINYDKRHNNIYKALLNQCLDDNSIYNTIVPNLFITPSVVDLAAAEIELVNSDGWQKRLKTLIYNLINNYDYIFIDCPPSLGLLTINALTSSTSLIIPMQCEFFALEGLSNLLKTIELVKKNLNAHLMINGILLTMHDKRSRLCAQVEFDVRDYFNNLVYNTVIPRNIRVSEAPSHGKPAIIYDMRCSGSRSYLDLTNEFLSREEFAIMNNEVNE
jgi:chromosome partitioning protein